MKTKLLPSLFVVVACAVTLVAVTGCTVLSTLLANSEYVTIKPEKISSIDRRASTAITQQVLGVVDRVASKHHMHRIYSPEADKALKSETYLRRYSNATTLDHYQVVILVRSSNSELFPTIYVQGSTGGVSEIDRVAKELAGALRQEVEGVGFKLETHRYTEFI